MLQIVKKKEKKFGGKLGQLEVCSMALGQFVGIFNTVRFPSEKKNCSRITKSMTDHSDFIEDMSLLDLQLAGGRYTWRKGDKHDIAARLDRFLASDEWNGGFKNIKQSILQKVTSDHSPILLQCGNWEPVRSYFKFENWWLQIEGFLDRVKEWWTSFDCEGRTDFILAFKLKALKIKLREWSKSAQGNLAL
uniref:Putative ovule protein n=1 Tax=Solanum chacoense TaxID=4108 RepID=A0A0V0HAJ5_SOLCH